MSTSLGNQKATKTSITKTVSAIGFMTTALIMSLSLPLNATAEVIKVPVGQQISSTNSGNKPTQGMSKRTVEAQYGQPNKLITEVGTPPISSWEYANFTVYFESEYVIQSVFKNNPVKEIHQTVDEESDVM